MAMAFPRKNVRAFSPVCTVAPTSRADGDAGCTAFSPSAVMQKSQTRRTVSGHISIAATCAGIPFFSRRKSIEAVLLLMAAASGARS